MDTLNPVKVQELETFSGDDSALRPSYLVVASDDSSVPPKKITFDRLMQFVKSQLGQLFECVGYIHIFPNGTYDNDKKFGIISFAQQIATGTYEVYLNKSITPLEYIVVASGCIVGGGPSNGYISNDFPYSFDSAPGGNPGHPVNKITFFSADDASRNDMIADIYIIKIKSIY